MPTVPPGSPTSDRATRVGSYELVRLLGEGSMGRVYEARHLKLGRRVAIK
ncbi:MAG TPA: serine/threonine protein kinase, partial [Myxococcaceae bacterium]|nr:serine/threonine protein kinase [Myxococcaceae bacterium]